MATSTTAATTTVSATTAAAAAISTAAATNTATSAAAANLAASERALAVRAAPAAATTAAITAAATAAEAAGTRGQLLQLRVNLLVGFAQHVQQILGLLGIGIGEQGVRRTSGVGTTGPADTMNVVLRVLRVIEVDDELDAVNVCCEKYGRGEIC